MTSERRVRLLLLVLIFSLAALLADTFLLTPFIRKWSEHRERIEQLSHAIEEGHSLITRGDSLRQTWQSMKEKGLPADDSTAENEILKAIHRWAEVSRINMTAIRPRWIQDDSSYRCLEVRATGQGNLRAVTRFLYELECDPLPLKIEAIEIASRDDNGENLTLGIRFNGLLLIEEETS